MGGICYRADCYKADNPGERAEHNGLTLFGKVYIIRALKHPQGQMATSSFVDLVEHLH